MASWGASPRDDREVRVIRAPRHHGPARLDREAAAPQRAHERVADLERCLRPGTQVAGPAEQRRLLQASGRFGAHADFMNGWNQDTLEALVAALN